MLSGYISFILKNAQVVDQKCRLDKSLINRPYTRKDVYAMRLEKHVLTKRITFQRAQHLTSLDRH